MTWTACGKEVLKDGLHFADTNDPASALYTANALNAYVGSVDVPCDICKLINAHVPTCENRARGATLCDTSNSVARGKRNM